MPLRIAWLSRNSANASSLDENFNGNIFPKTTVMLSLTQSIFLATSHLQLI